MHGRCWPNPGASPDYSRDALGYGPTDWIRAAFVVCADGAPILTTIRRNAWCSAGLEHHRASLMNNPGLATDFVVHYTAYGHAVPDRIFNLGSENNFPTYFSSVNLLACGVLLFFIYRSRSSSADGQEKQPT